ncbi:sulfated surface glycoprotein 185-like [Impatiens glandulifera]|uniref:sulfated surface glycoprotein 185-like n=1 Tax=Impatiens glandulifera TaxID=253017 RepID=UPI001FB139AD|nr:sulfated surface glycoprotein 185-like [Impatiens glandulifera]
MWHQVDIFTMIMFMLLAIINATTLISDQRIEISSISTTFDEQEPMITINPCTDRDQCSQPPDPSPPSYCTATTVPSPPPPLPPPTPPLSTSPPPPPRFVYFPSTTPPGNPYDFSIHSGASGWCSSATTVLGAFVFLFQFLLLFIN